MIKYLSQPVMERLRNHFALLYGPHEAQRCCERLAMLIGRYGIGFELAAQRSWNEGDALLITYGDMLSSPTEPPLKTLKRFLDSHVREAIRFVHILPFYPYSSDDGFSVMHYRTVNPALGSWEDVRALGEHFDILFDLVLNHVSRQSAWFNDYSLGVDPAAQYFIEVDPAANLAAVVRPRSAPLLTRVHTRHGERHLWTTFSDDQIDLNYANPDVLFEMLDLMLYYTAHGAAGLRLDAVAYLWKKIGSTCIHLPETHAVVKIFRDFLRLAAPQVLLLSETNVPHEENVSYFGDGDEAHVVYQFSLPPLLLHALLTGNATYLTRWAATLGAPAAGCTFLNFTASHDGRGMRPLQGLLPEPEIQQVVDQVRRRGGQVSTRRLADGADQPYELNISYYDALSFPDHPASQLHLARFICSQSIPMALKGIPAFYFNSLLATPNDDIEVRRTGRARSINRKKWDERELESLLNQPSSPTAQTLKELTARLRLRAAHPAFHPDGPQLIHDWSPAVFAVERRAMNNGETILCVHNMTAQPAGIPLQQEMTDLIGKRVFKPADLLAPYQVAWLI
ncbi:MAG: alpha-amylase family glycosyl hydrolase [Lentisphaerota bacterium]